MAFPSAAALSAPGEASPGAAGLEGLLYQIPLPSLATRSFPDFGNSWRPFPYPAPILESALAQSADPTLGREELLAILTAAGWPRELHEAALAIIQCESRGNPNAISATGDYGLFQINAATWAEFFGEPPSTWLDPLTNARRALVIYQRSGSRAPWTCRLSVED